MEFILYDTEYTSWEGSLQRLWTGEGEEREIVQISAILVKDLQSLNGTEFFSVYTKPICNPILSDYFKNLTGIEQHTIDNFGINISEGLEKFSKFSKNKLCLCWGDDLLVINENIKLHNLKTSLNMLKNIDLRDIFNEFQVDTSLYNSGTIETFSEEETIMRSGSEHNALSDCISMLAALLKLRNMHGKDKFDKNWNKFIKNL